MTLLPSSTFLTSSFTLRSFSLFRVVIGSSTFVTSNAYVLFIFTIVFWCLGTTSTLKVYGSTFASCFDLGSSSRFLRSLLGFPSSKIPAFIPRSILMLLTQFPFGSGSIICSLVWFTFSHLVTITTIEKIFTGFLVCSEGMLFVSTITFTIFNNTFIIKNTEIVFSYNIGVVPLSGFLWF